MAYLDTLFVLEHNVLLLNLYRNIIHFVLRLCSNLTKYMLHLSVPFSCLKNFSILVLPGEGLLLLIENTLADLNSPPS